MNETEVTPLCVCVCCTELIESAMYLYKATGDPTFMQLGRDVIESIDKISRVDCGFATVSVSELHFKMSLKTILRLKPAQSLNIVIFMLF